MFNNTFLILLILFVFSYQQCERGKNFCIFCEKDGKKCKQCENDHLFEPDEEGGCKGHRHCEAYSDRCTTCNTTSNLCQTCDEGFVPDNNGGCSTTENCEIAENGQCILCKNNYKLIYKGNPYLECVSLDSEELLYCNEDNITMSGHCTQCKENYYLNEGDNKCSNTPKCYSSTKGICDKCGSSYEDFIDDSDELVYDEDYDEPDASIGDSSLPPIFGVIFGGILLVVIVVAVGISVFVLNPMSVGLYKYFLDNSDNPSAGLTRSNIGLGFSNHYMNFVGAIFATELFTFLWTLLLIVPGIIKQLEWRMVRYILAENPEMSGADARALSSEMMDGNKWDVFVLDLSFIGWTLLGTITLGIGNIIWTNPYHAATNTELYLALKNSRTKTDNMDAEEHSDIANVVRYENDVEVEVE